MNRGENMADKMLIKKEKISFFQKINRFIKNLFKKDGKQEDAIKVIEEEKESNANTISKLRNDQKILSLQDRYEKGQILESDLTENEKEELISLYKEQIGTLEQSIDLYNRKLENTKEIILEKQNSSVE